MLLRPYFLLCVFACLLCSSTWTQAQNLVPNPGFEEIEVPSEGHLFFDKVLHWENTNLRQNTSLFGTPDHLTDTDDEGLRFYRTSFAPHEGRSIAGLITYMQRVRNYREYLTVPLIEPMQVGTTYRLSFWISSGDRAPFGSIGASGMGALLSTQRPSQQVYEPLTQFRPQWQLQEVFFRTGWYEVSTELVADSAYRFLTLGNFRPDAQTQVRYFFFDVDPQAYVYIDEVRIEKWPPPTELSAPVEPQPTVEQRMLESRQVKTAKRIQVPPGTPVEIRVWDDKFVDGDIISLLFNEKWLLREYSLRRKQWKTTFTLVPGAENRLVLFAHNMGKMPPNTAAVQVLYKGKKIQFSLSSTLTECEAVEFYE